MVITFTGPDFAQPRRAPRRSIAALLAAITLGWLAPASAGNLAPDLSDLQSVPLSMVTAPLEKAIESARSGKGGPYRFAVRTEMSRSLNDGRWDFPDAQTARWRLRISSPGATSLNFQFDRFRLPPDAELWLYDAAGRQIDGPYTPVDRAPDGKLWTAIVRSSEVVMEIRVPAVQRDQVDLQLAAVNHGFRDFEKSDTSSKALTDPIASYCNIDLVCPQGDEWHSQARAVGMLQIAGNTYCTGQLVNDVPQDEKPYLTTGHHCDIGQNKCGQNFNQFCDPSSVVVYWNYFNSTCRSRAPTDSGTRNGDGSTAQHQNASALIADDEHSDLSLLLLKDKPPAAFNVYYSGWNANVPNTKKPASGVSIHHPLASQQSLAVFNQAAVAVNDCDVEGNDCTTGTNTPIPVDVWQVQWSDGITQNGSSGGGLWDQDHRLVGWLTAGGTTCVTPNAKDYFGRVDSAWASKPANNQQLKHWLDPSNSGTISMAGHDPTGTKAIDDTYDIAKDSAAQSLKVLNNDHDDPGVGLGLVSVTATDHGGTATKSGKQVQYKPAAGFTGTETFSYTMHDSANVTKTAKVTVNVFAPGSGGGGALAPLTLLGLAAASLRRRRRH